MKQETAVWMNHCQGISCTQTRLVIVSAFNGKEIKCEKALLPFVFHLISRDATFTAFVGNPTFRLEFLY